MRRRRRCSTRCAAPASAAEGAWRRRRRAPKQPAPELELGCGVTDGQGDGEYFSPRLNSIRSSPPGTTRLGDASLMLGREEEALGHFMRAVAVSHGSDGTTLGLGSTYALLGRVEEARVNPGRAPGAAAGGDDRLSAAAVHGLFPAPALARHERAAARRTAPGRAARGIAAAIGARGLIRDAAPRLVAGWAGRCASARFACSGPHP